MQYFVTTAHYLNFSRAAEALHLTQPSLSEQIKRLEEELGCRLFERTRRQVYLTQEGAALLPHAQRILAQVRDAEAEIQDRINLRRGVITFGALPTVVQYRLPPVLATIRRRFPGLELRLVERGTGRLLHLLDHGELDLALVTAPVDAARFDARHVASERLLLIIAGNNPLASRIRRLRDVAALPFIQYDPDYGLRNVIEEACRQAGFAPQTAFEVGGTETIKRLVAAGLGVGIVPESAIERHDLVRIAAIELLERPTRAIAIVTRKGRYLPAAVRTVAKHLHAGLTDRDGDAVGAPVSS